MSYRTVEVEVDHGRVLAKGAESLPGKVSGLLTILQSDAVNPSAISPLQALESLQEHLHLDANQAAEWMTSVHEVPFWLRAHCSHPSSRLAQNRPGLHPPLRRGIK